jgi:preprotein translocase SecE subunit
MTAIMKYFSDSIQELELVRWPTRQQAIRLSTIVLVFTVVSALVFGAIDYVFGLGISALITSTL